MESILYDSKKSQTYKFGLHILEYVPRDKDQSIIDIGSGSGSLTKELQHYGGCVIGVDKSVSVIEHAKKKYPTVPFYVMDALRLQYASRFDIAFSNAVFQEIEDKARLFASIFKALKVSGKLIAEFPSKNGNKEFFDSFEELAPKYGLTMDDCTYKLVDKEECRALLEEAGFSVEVIEENSRRTFVRGGDANVRELIDATIRSDVEQDIREAFVNDLIGASQGHFKSPRGWINKSCKILFVARKDHE